MGIEVSDSKDGGAAVLPIYMRGVIILRKYSPPNFVRGHLHPPLEILGGYFDIAL